MLRAIRARVTKGVPRLGMSSLSGSTSASWAENDDRRVHEVSARRGNHFGGGNALDVTGQAVGILPARADQLEEAEIPCVARVRAAVHGEVPQEIRLGARELGGCHIFCSCPVHRAHKALL